MANIIKIGSQQEPMLYGVEMKHTWPASCPDYYYDNYRNLLVTYTILYSKIYSHMQDSEWQGYFGDDPPDTEIVYRNPARLSEWIDAVIVQSDIPYSIFYSITKNDSGLNVLMLSLEFSVPDPFVIKNISGNELVRTKGDGIPGEITQFLVELPINVSYGIKIESENSHLSIPYTIQDTLAPQKLEVYAGEIAPDREPILSDFLITIVQPADNVIVTVTY